MMSKYPEVQNYEKVKWLLNEHHAELKNAPDVDVLDASGTDLRKLKLPQYCEPCWHEAPPSGLDSTISGTMYLDHYKLLV